MTTSSEFRPIRILVVGASLRSGSLNRHLAGLAASATASKGAVVDHADIREFDVASFDRDVQDRDGVPQGAIAFGNRLKATDGFILVSPEYNASIPGFLKNLIDWTSRIVPQPFKGSHGLLMSASPSMVGGNRGLWALRVPLEHLGAIIYPDMFSLAQAHLAFDDSGQIADAELHQRFSNAIGAFLDLTEAATHYQCAKSAWVEFLGEKRDPAIDRVEVS